MTRIKEFIRNHIPKIVGIILIIMIVIVIITLIMMMMMMRQALMDQH